MESTKLKVCITAVLAVSCASAVYAILRFKRRYRVSSEVLNYMDIQIVSDEAVCDEVVGEIRRRSLKLHAIGFDCEWVTDNGKRQAVALLQLSTLDGYCSLFRLNQMKIIPGTLKLVNKRYSHATRSKPLYNNGILQAPDGELLCTCDSKKARWYVEKGLASVVDEGEGEAPLTVRLRFEPAGRSVGDVGRFYQIAKENKCVVCGNTDSYIRKNVVPREYRKYFPEVMKDHSSHDVVLLCARCHQRANALDLRPRLALAALCGAPLAARDHARPSEDAAHAKKIRSAARALLYKSQKHTLPAARRRELEETLLRHFPAHARLSRALLQEAAVAPDPTVNNNEESHGLKVVEYFLNHDGLLRLEEYWRDHFLESMEPKYMPALWSTKHNEERLRVRFEEGRLSENDLHLLGLTKWL
ncbi:hypothetical protein MSG28_000646 [Choristoneura fumiferana]|uniref:Uncharacterized protein n=1 Tax=Choristoneura fumiferana TaxID=7141 RepID=A0ACC0K1W0_CHOFU|nr:hypothetical protein MSG28_000646 [Choristoneura fumiferana]